MNKILINETEIAGDVLVSGSDITSHAMVGETLAADQLTCVVNTEDQPFIPADQEYPLITADHHVYFAKNEIDVTAFRDGDEVLYFDAETLAGKYFFESVVQQGMDRWKITAVSLIGRLLNSRHYGGVYVGVMAAEIFADILGGTNYVLDPDVANATVTGYLPIASRRDNLKQLLMATGATVRIDSAGVIYITSMSPVETGQFSAGRCYIGGSVTTDKPVSGVKVTEHNYFPAGNIVTLFDDGVDGEELIEFREPYHDLAIEGGTILESGANYARISAKGTVILTGQPYTHVTRIVTAGTVDAASTENVKTVSSCYLANPQIAQALADRFYAYLKCNRTISQDVLVGTEQAGDVVSVLNPYTMEMETATIRQFDITMSGVNKAKAEFVVGFAPAGVLSGFTSHTVLTGSGTWTVPEGVTKIRIILVGGGSGGSGGNDGLPGTAAELETSYPYTPVSIGTGGAGGAAGKAGSGGKIFEISLDVAAGQEISFTCGTGGAGGAANGGEGIEGAETTFGSYSSNYGRLYPYGYYEAKTGITLSAAGEEGFAGGRGGDAKARTTYYTGPNGDSGESVNGYSGGAGSAVYEDDVSSLLSYYYYGNGGGGAANGNKGGNAGSKYGGAGATGIAGANGINYGQGGGAGNGGGGGGGGNVAWVWQRADPDYFRDWITPGTAGSGSKGGAGADGAIIIYY